MRIEAKTLEDAYYKASKEFNCSITDLDIKIIQHSSRGILGLFSKKAIIEVEKKEKTIDDVIEEIKEKLKKLFEKSCFKIDTFEVKKYDEDTIYIKLDGKDAALLIGREGYRYNALNFIIYNWIYQKYGFKVRIEIAKFIESQQEMLKDFLKPFIEKVKEKGYGKTKPFNGILTFLALEILREAFPDKYVAIKEKNSEKYIVVRPKDGYNNSNSNT